MEEEVRDILRREVGLAPPANLAAAIRARIAPLGGVDIDPPARVSRIGVRSFILHCATSVHARKKT